MDASRLATFLDERRFCVLATTTAQGHAQARPVAFTVLGASFWFATVAGNRLRNLERTPWASVVVTDGERGSHRAVAADFPARPVGFASGAEHLSGAAATRDDQGERGWRIRFRHSAIADLKTVSTLSFGMINRFDKF